MRKLILLMLLLNCLTISAFETSSNYGFVKQETADAYQQQYVGKDFIFRPAWGTLESWYKSGFKYEDSYDNKIFTISKILVNDVILEDKPNKEIYIEAVEKNGKKKEKFKVYEELTIKEGVWSNKVYTNISNVPIVFIEPFEEYKSAHIGETITHEMVRDQYEIIDIFMGEGEGKNYATAEVNIKVRNKRTNETKECLYSARGLKPFEDALKGSYKTALYKVEKPESSSIRYGETKIIQDEGIDKFSYNDSTINIVIFGNTEKFYFVLTNLTQNSLKMIWNEAVFVGLDGNTSKIMHTGIKYADREGDQPATTIIRGAKIEDIAVPTTNVYYDEGVKIGYTSYGNGWKTKSFLPASYVGKEAGEVRLMLPIQIKDVVNEYTFVFRVYYTYDHPELLNAEKL